MPPQKRCRVTVVIPCYNYGHFLPMAVSSALDQPAVDVDVIIVDDSSTDGSQEIAAQLADADERVYVIYHDANQGHIRTYNHGLSVATGEYVVLLSADDLLAPGALARSTSLMEANPTVGLVYGYAPEFEMTPSSSASRRESWSTWGGAEWIKLMCRRGNNLIVNPEAILRRSLMESLVGYREDMPQAADMDLWLRAASLADVGRVNGPDQAYYRSHANNMHRTAMSGTIRETAARKEVFENIGQMSALTAEQRLEFVGISMRKLSREITREAKKYWDDSERPSSEICRQFMDLAVSCDPHVQSTISWRLLELRQVRGFPALIAFSEGAIYKVIWSLRWRRWRRVGI